MVIRNRFFLATDLVTWSLAPALALALRLDGFSAIDDYSRHLAAYTAAAIAVKFTALWLAGLYRRYWSYASIEEMSLLAAAILLAGVVQTAIYFAVVQPLADASPGLPRSLPILDTMVTLIFTGAARFSLRVAQYISAGRPRHVARFNGVLIVGAGDAGWMVARELRGNPQVELLPVGFLDDDPAKVGNRIHGCPVLGTRKDLARVAGEYGIAEVIIAMPTALGSVIRSIRDDCARAGLHVRTIPGMYEIISGQVSVAQIRDVQIEDLLRRKPVKTDHRAVEELVKGSTVLVTGAGGSIGSEVCRQAARLGAAELILLGHGENSIFDIHNELLLSFPGLNVVPVIADIRDGTRVLRAFDTYRPQVVFHTAAHKHVPLMELNPEEAVTNNVLGTANVLSAAERTGVSRFVFISTDKAVNPVNVMGATKLLAEMLVHDAALRTGAPYVSVRFGNVLASRGSVVPLFKRQILAGGPLTVTHPDMCRYFMTIPEAVQLVMQAAALGRGGETFLLDMGEPVKIVDLAKDLIHLSGLEEGKDINIVFTGLRPGEKIFEELYSNNEEFERTDHEKVFRLRQSSAPDVRRDRLGDVIAAAQMGDGLRVRQQLSEMLPVYNGSERRTPTPQPAAAKVSKGSA